MRILVHNENQPDYTVRRATTNGKEYMVVPVVMMVEGVHNGSGGPILHLQEYFSQNPSDWDGVPLTSGHPRNLDGDFVSVNAVQSAHWVVGHLANTRVEDGKLKSEAWIDVNRAIAVDPEIINYIKENKPLDVSTGAMTTELQKAGQWNGEEYSSITHNYYPDHLALLPGAQGACSWGDGCGIRNNQQEESNDPMKTKKQELQEIDVVNNLQANAAGYVEISSQLQSLLDRRDSDAQMFFLSEVYDDYFIYEVRDRDQGKKSYYRQNYSYNEGDGEINLEGSQVEVRKNVEFVPIQNNKEEHDGKETSNNSGCGCSMTRTKFNTNQNQKEDNTMSDSNDKQPSGDVMEKVVSLVNNERTRFAKSDRDWLLQLNESQLDKLQPTEAPTPEVTREDALQALSEDLSDTDKLLDIVPKETADKLRNGIKAYEDSRNSLIQTIQANTGDIWTKEKLESMDTETLQSLEKSTRKTDYSGQGRVIQDNSEASASEDMLLPAGVQLEN